MLDIGVGIEVDIGSGIDPDIELDLVSLGLTCSMSLWNLTLEGTHKRCGHLQCLARDFLFWRTDC